MHDPCSLRNVQRITDAPRTLLARAGFELREIAEAHFCCGSAGTYNLLEPDIARRLGERKAARLEHVAHQKESGECEAVVNLLRRRIFRHALVQKRRQHQEPVLPRLARLARHRPP